MRPTWVEVSLSALRQNLRALQKHVGPAVTLCPVVKADGYGHGAVGCARALEAAGAGWFGVCSTEEGLGLRQGGIRGRILLLSGFWPGEQEVILEQGLTAAVWAPEQVELLAAAQKKIGRADAVAGKHLEGAHKKAGPAAMNNDAALQPAAPGPEGAAVHLKIDTGMARLGIALADLEKFWPALRRAPQVALEGVFTHLASSEMLDAPDAQAQIARFETALAAVNTAGFEPAYVHMANSAALAARPQTWKNMVRPGLAVYGYLPAITGDAAGRDFEIPLTPALTWKTRILALREVPAGQAISYNGAYVTRAPARIAVLPVGYADGLSRRLSSSNLRAHGSLAGGRVIVRGQYAPILGRVTMDLTVVDVTLIAGASVGDEVVLLGAAGDCAVSALEHAAIAGTIPYEILCAIAKRVRRKYVK